MPDYDRSFRRRATGPLEGLADLRAGQRPDPRGSRFDQRPDQRADQRSDQRPDQRADQRFDQRLDQWIATGRQLVDGVAGARPGSRASGRPQPGGRAGGLPRPGGLGRWVEDKLDWILEEEDDWREPWQEARQEARPHPRSDDFRPEPRAEIRPRRRPLEAISRRRAAPQPPEAAEWPSDEAFVVPRWQRGAAAAPSSQTSQSTQSTPETPATPAAPPARALPRSTRRRADG